MIKAKVENTIVLGLSDENVKRLQAGDPIFFNLKELEMGDANVLIFNGRTEESMYLEMVDYISLTKTKMK